MRARRAGRPNIENRRSAQRSHPATIMSRVTRLCDETYDASLLAQPGRKLESRFRSGILAGRGRDQGESSARDRGAISGLCSVRTARCWVHGSALPSPQSVSLSSLPRRTAFCLDISSERSRPECSRMGCPRFRDDRRRLSGGGAGRAIRRSRRRAGLAGPRECGGRRSRRIGGSRARRSCSHTTRPPRARSSRRRPERS